MRSTLTVWGCPALLSDDWRIVSDAGALVQDATTDRAPTTSGDGAGSSSGSGSGTCTGTCVPGRSRCSGAASQTCDATGTWQTTQACPFVCTGSGTCSGTCVPGAAQCSASTPQTCDGTGTWQSQAGTCGGEAGAGHVCPSGGCNAQSGICSASGQGCYCTSDSQCLSGKCVKVSGQNNASCGANCTGSGAADGFDCALASPGIPTITSSGFSCPAGSGYQGTTLTCDSTHTNCYCSGDNQCPSGKCVPSAANNNSCAGGTCTGAGSTDYRGCQPASAIPGCPKYVGCPASTTCSYPTCY